MRGRPKINISKEKILEVIKNNKYLKDAAKSLKISYPTFISLCEDHDINPKKEADNFKYDWLFELLGLDKNGKEINEDEIPQLNIVELEVPRSMNYILIVLLGDVHYGHKDCNKEFFAKVMKWLYENKYVYLITMGDLCEVSLKDSPGLFEQERFSKSQVYRMIKMLKPIADEGRLLGMHQGNHEKRIFNKSGFDITDVMTLMLGVPYFGYSVAHRIYLNQGNKREMYKMYTTHGNSRAQYAHTKLNASLRMAGVVDNAEIYAMGHVHELGNTKASPYHIPDEGEKLERSTKIFLLTGSYLKYWGTYAHDKSYMPPGATGSPKVKFHIDEHRITVSF